MSDINDVRKQAIVMLCKGNRKAQRLTLVAAGNRTNYHYTTLSKFERGYRFSWDMAEAYARNILNPAERATYEKIKEDILNGR